MAFWLILAGAVSLGLYLVNPEGLPIPQHSGEKIYGKPEEEEEETVAG